MCPLLWKSKGSIAVMLFLFFLCSGSAQNVNIRRFNMADGLAHDICYQVTQSSDGFLWIGTDAGLSRFDGKYFKNYTIQDGLSSPYVIYPTEGLGGAMWLGTHKKGINYLRDGKIREIPIPNWQMHDPMVITTEDGGEVVFSDKGMYCTICDDLSAGNNCRRYQFFLKDQELQMLESGNKKKQATRPVKLQHFVPFKNAIFLVTKAGVFQMKKKDSNWLIEPYYLEKGISRIAPQQDGSLYFVKEDQLFFLDPTKQVRSLSITFPNPATIFPLGDYLVLGGGPKRNQLKLYHSKDGRLLKDLAAEMGVETEISSVIFDQDQNLWIGTNGSGLFCLSFSPFQNFTLESGLDNTNVLFLEQTTDGTIWLGGNNGIFTFDEEVIRPFPIPQSPQLSRSNVQRIVAIDDNRLFFRVSGLPISKIENREVVSCEIPGGFTKSFFPDEDRRHLYFYRKPFIYRTQDCIDEEEVFDIGILHRKFDRVPGNSMLLHPIDQTGNIWWNQSDTLFCIQKDSICIFDKHRDFPSAFLNMIRQGPEGKWWLGSIDGAFYLQQEDGGGFEVSPLLVEGNVKDIVFDKNGAAWLGTEEGLVRYDPSSEQLNKYSAESGLAGNRVHDLLLTKEGIMWVATNGGVSRFIVEELSWKNKSSRVFLEECYLNNVPVQRAMPKILPFKTSIRLLFTSLHLPFTQNIQFEWRLRDSDPWTPNDSRSLFLSELRPENYRLQVRARSSDSDWSEPLELPFEIAPPWWQLWWVRLIAGALLIGLIWGVFRFQMRRLREKDALEQKLLELELNALQSQMNPHFLFNALNAIQYFIFKKDQLTANRYISKFSRLMRLFLESSNSSITLLEDEVELLELYIELEQLRLKHKFDYSVQVIPPLASSGTRIYSTFLQPFVENAINHGIRHKEGKGQLDIRFEQHPKGVKCIIEDDGIGRRQAKELADRSNKSYESRGMQLIADRVEVIEQLNERKIEIQIVDLLDENQQSAGTRVEIVLPNPGIIRTK
jgi:ligand-binding sensor domain-containing protein